MSLFVTRTKCPDRTPPQRKIEAPKPPNTPKFILKTIPPQREAPKREFMVPEPLKYPKPKATMREFEFKEMREKVLLLKETYKNEDDLLKEYLQILPEVRKILRNNITIESIISCPIGQAYFMKFLVSEFSSENLEAYLDADIIINHLNSKRDTSQDKIKQMINQFIDLYLKRNSGGELNVPTFIQTLFNELNMKMKEEKDFEEVKKTVLNVFIETKNVCIFNLSDSFFRFFSSTYIIELGLHCFGNDLKKKQLEYTSAGKNEKIILNNSIKWNLKVVDPSLLSEQLVQDLQEIISDESLWKNGVYVNDNLFNMGKFLKFQQNICKFQSVDISNLGEKEKICFFINLHNIMMIYGGILSNGYPLNYLNREIVFKKTYFDVGKELFSIDQVKNIILKDNKSINDLIDSKKIDLLFSLVDLTPHSPTLQIFYPKNFEEELEIKGKKYTIDKVTFDHKNSKIHLPPIFFNLKKFYNDKSGKQFENFLKKYLQKYLSIPLDYQLVSQNEDYNFEITCCFTEFQFKRIYSSKRFKLGTDSIFYREHINQFQVCNLKDLNSIKPLFIKNWVNEIKISLFKVSKSIYSHQLITFLEKNKDASINRSEALLATQFFTDKYFFFVEGNKVKDDKEQMIYIQEDLVEISSQPIIHGGILSKQIEESTPFKKVKVNLYNNGMLIMEDNKLESSYFLFKPVQLKVEETCDSDFDVKISPYTVLHFRCYDEEEKIEWLNAFAQLDVYVYEE